MLSVLLQKETSQVWIINDLLGKLIEDYGGEPYKVENGKLIIKNKEN